MIQSLTAIRYVTPLREGGSLPAVVETAEDGLWVVKFRGAGQGAKALIAELVVGLVARALGLPVPDLAVVSVDPAFGRTEGDPEIQDILRGSHGPNVGLRYLDGAFNYEERPVRDLHIVPAEMKTPVVWLDALVMNIDRTPRNPNLLVWNRRPWLIDHGAALYFHHNWSAMTREKATIGVPGIAMHLFLAEAVDLENVDETLARRLPESTLTDILAAIPDALLEDPVSGEPGIGAVALRQRYLDLLSARLVPPRPWMHATAAMRDAQQTEPRRRLEARR